MKRLALLLWAVSAFAAPTLVTVTQQLFKADGTPYQGTVAVQWQTFDTAANEHIPAGTKILRLSPTGVLTVALAPNIGATPSGTAYTVTYKLDLGESRQVSWIVPASGPVTVTAIESTALVGPSTVVSTSQLPAPVVLNNQANTYSTGLQNFGSAQMLVPVGTSNPGTCTTGQVFLRSDLVAGRNWMLCTATNTWTQMSAPIQNSKSTAYTTVLADAGVQLYHPSADTTARVWTIDSNANVSYPLNTCITFVNDSSAGTLTIAITSDTLMLGGAGTTGSRTLAAGNIATACKITTTKWIISGTSGLT